MKVPNTTSVAVAVSQFKSAGKIAHPLGHRLVWMPDHRWLAVQCELCKAWEWTLSGKQSVIGALTQPCTQAARAKPPGYNYTAELASSLMEDAGAAGSRNGHRLVWKPDHRALAVECTTCKEWDYARAGRGVEGALAEPCKGVEQ